MVNLPVYIINYTPLADRLRDTISCVKALQLGNRITIVSPWDRDCICFGASEYSTPALWSDGLRCFYYILHANAIGMKDLASHEIVAFKSLDPCPWALPRKLSAGEVSVLLKHYFAISSIACSDCNYGLILEDDVRYHSQSRVELQMCFSEASALKVDFLDLAGGCNLVPYTDEYCLESSRISILKIPRTRTAAGYLVSKRLAVHLANKFMPLIYPIDWHLQYLFMSPGTSFVYAWTTNPPLIHGSESGLVQSWRSN